MKKTIIIAIILALLLIPRANVLASIDLEIEVLKIRIKILELQIQRLLVLIQEIQLEKETAIEDNPEIKPETKTLSPDTMLHWYRCGRGRCLAQP